MKRGPAVKPKAFLALVSLSPFLLLVFLVLYYFVPRIGFGADTAFFILFIMAAAAIDAALIVKVAGQPPAAAPGQEPESKAAVGNKPPGGPVDEVGVLDETFNQLSACIKNNMDELKLFSGKTAAINLKIQEHVQVFSNLLQISSLISRGVSLEDILKFALEKLQGLPGVEKAYLLFKEEGEDVLFMKAAVAEDTRPLLKIRMAAKGSIFAALVETGKPLTLDRENIQQENAAWPFYEKFGIRNTLALAVYLKEELVGILGVGNTQKDFAYKKDDLELLDIFTRQLAIAIENDRLAHRVKKLEIRDPLTGLYNKTYILDRLQEEIRRAMARQRPCSFILFNIDEFQRFRDMFREAQGELALKTIASLIRDSVTEIDRVARFADNSFAVVLPERNKRQAQEIAEQVRKKIEAGFDREGGRERKLTVSGGVSENPLDGTDAKELVSRAEGLLTQAKKEGKNRIAA